MVFGKIIGGLLGFSSFGIFGAIAGVYVGHIFDKGLGNAMGFDYGSDRVRLQRLFFETSFAIMGHLAKADGRISEEEIAQAETLMQRIGLSDENRKEAINLFKKGALPDFQLEPIISRFIDEGGRQHNLPNVLLEFLFSMALADGELHSAERNILNKVAGFLGISNRQFERLLAMLMAQQQFNGSFSGGGSSHQSQSSYQRENSISNAYQALGVSSGASDKEIKKAYRQLMSQHHPDKLIAKGVPEDMIKIATEKAQEIQAAYDVIKKSRGKK